VLLQSKEIGTIDGNLAVESAWPKEWPTISSFLEILEETETNSMEMPELLQCCPQNASIGLLLVLWTGLELVEGVLEGNETELLQLCGWSVASMAWLPCLNLSEETWRDSSRCHTDAAFRCRQ
jgi:hypothetical protein